MRLPVSMLRRLSAGIFVLVLLLLAAAPVSADTGTYKISDYIVTLEPQNDGRVLITVEQQWEVLSGSIPWVTVGLPNNNFSIKDYSGDAARVLSSNDGSYYFVTVELKKDYRPGQTFNIKFTVLQGHLLERLTSEKKWRINYTPGWYDRATTDHLQINLISPVDHQSYTTTSPNPTAVNGDIITWEQFNVSPGGRLNIKVESMDGTFLTGTEPETTGGKKLGTMFYMVIGIVVVVGLLVFRAIWKDRRARDAEMKRRVTAIEEEMAKDEKKKAAIEEDFKEYLETKKIQPDEQGRYYDRAYGNYITPAIWAGIISSQYSRPHISPSSSSGTTYRPSCVSCACVSCACACACACAGGGAAGCSRKSLHECRTCTVKKEGKAEGQKAL